MIATAIVGVFSAGAVFGLDGVLSKSSCLTRHPALRFAAGLLG